MKLNKEKLQASIKILDDQQCSSLCMVSESTLVCAQMEVLEMVIDALEDDELEAKP